MITVGNGENSKRGITLEKSVFEKSLAEYYIKFQVPSSNSVGWRSARIHTYAYTHTHTHIVTDQTLRNGLSWAVIGWFNHSSDGAPWEKKILMLS